MKDFLNSFGLTAKERRGFFVLLVLLGGLLLFPFVRSFFQSSDAVPLPFALVVFSEEREENQNVAVENDVQGLLSGPIAATADRGALFYFDPNDLPVSMWKKLGLSDRQVQVIKNYEAKGGRFYRKEDVQKLYSISDEFYQRIEPYIQIQRSAAVPDAVQADLEVSRPTESERSNRAVPVLIDINRADTAEWQRLRGIGPAFSNRIVRFRDALGGFHAVEQLQEVYGLSEELYQQIAPYLISDNYAVNKIKVNTANKELLMSHPYISPKQADAIVKYRDQHGPYDSLEEMRKIIVLDDGFLRKIEAYLDFET